MDGSSCLLVGESWNLKARLLDLVNLLDRLDHLDVTYELCDEDRRTERLNQLNGEFTGSAERNPAPDRKWLNLPVSGANRRRSA